MTAQMEWGSLLTKERSLSGDVGTIKGNDPLAFQKDAQRILYSSPFRRLQGKTQVHPLPKFDYLRTRLTHSLEVAHVGKLIASECGEAMSQSGSTEISPTDLSDIVYAACLAHDVGNPPFGHIGEFAIQTWFARCELKSVKTIKDDSSTRKQDFLFFDGNAQGFRVLTRLSGWRDDGGLQLSYATLGAFSKYPFSSKLASSDKRKFGYMSDDHEIAEKVFGGLGLIKDGERYCRHPLAFIVEAADDICYLTTDIEDAYRVDLLQFPSAESLLRDIAETGGKVGRYQELNNAPQQDRVAYLRSRAILALVDACVKCFSEKKDSILEGKFNSDLLSISKYNKNVSEIKFACEKTIYKEENKLRTEAAGYNMIMVLMDMFGGMIDQYVQNGLDKLDMRNTALHDLLPEEFRIRLCKGDPYRSFLVLVDYISGMTDRFVLDTYQRLTGSSVVLGKMA